MENLLATPVRPLEVMLGKIIPYVGVGFVQASIILTTAAVLFQVPIMGSLVLLAICGDGHVIDVSVAVDVRETDRVPRPECVGGWVGATPCDDARVLAHCDGGLRSIQIGSARPRRPMLRPVIARSAPERNAGTRRLSPGAVPLNAGSASRPISRLRRTPTAGLSGSRSRVWPAHWTLGPASRMAESSPAHVLAHRPGGMTRLARASQVLPAIIPGIAVDVIDLGCRGLVTKLAPGIGA